MVALATRFCGSSKPRNCFTSRKQTSKGQRREKISSICVGCQGEVGREEAIVAAAAAGVTHHDDAQQLLPALEYHKASMD